MGFEPMIFLKYVDLANQSLKPLSQPPNKKLIRTKGFEPISPVPKTDILTFKLHPYIVYFFLSF